MISSNGSMTFITLKPTNHWYLVIHSHQSIYDYMFFLGKGMFLAYIHVPAMKMWKKGECRSAPSSLQPVQVNMSNISKKSKGLLILILVLASSILRWNEVHCLGACWCFQPARWGPLDSRFYQSRFSRFLLLHLLLSPPAASDLASSGSQSAPPDINRELQMSVSTAGSQQRAPDLSGRWGPAVFMSERTSE